MGGSNLKKSQYPLFFGKGTPRPFEAGGGNLTKRNMPTLLPKESRSKTSEGKALSPDTRAVASWPRMYLIGCARFTCPGAKVGTRDGSFRQKNGGPNKSQGTKTNSGPSQYKHECHGSTLSRFRLDQRRRWSRFFLLVLSGNEPGNSLKGSHRRWFHRAHSISYSLPIAPAASLWLLFTLRPKVPS